MRTLYLVAITLFTTVYCSSQEETFLKSTLNKSHCATGPLLYDKVKDIQHDNRLQVNKNSGYSHWPINIHIVTKTDGTGGISLEDVTRGIANLNYVYDDINLEYFISSVNYINSDLYYDFVSTDEQDLLDAHFVADAMNVFFFNSIEINSVFYCGYAYYPSIWQYSATMMMDNQCTATAANGTFAHELGHHLNLPHTFNGTEYGNDHIDAEHVPRTGTNSNCSTHGDYQCDTEADPKANNSTELSNCVYTGSATDIHGNVYDPPINNIMSYYPSSCGGLLTPGQYNRCANAMTTRLGHTTYDIDGAAPMVVNNPSALTITINGVTNINIVLNWTDNASNEYGYLIERSEDGGGTFEAMELAGVGPDITSYTDSNEIMPNTNYCYRVKAVNDNSDHYSNEACGVTPNFVCSSSTALNFSAAGELIITPFNLTGVPTVIPSCQTDVPLTVTVVGDFDNTWEITDILGEDGTTVLGTTGLASALCDNLGATTAFNLTSSQYNTWAADGTITLYIGADSDIGDICPSSTVKGCADLCIPAPSCPPNYSGANQLTGTQATVADFETDGIIQSDQTINANVDYDSGDEINLLSGFEVMIGKVFNAFIDGCGNLFKSEDTGEK